MLELDVPNIINGDAIKSRVITAIGIIDFCIEIHYIFSIFIIGQIIIDNNRIEFFLRNEYKILQYN
jgi:hypothetical protein